MARMIPNTVRSSTRSLAERRLFNRFQRELPEGYLVFHSLGLKEHQRKIWAECDFVVVTGTGIFTIEVKGGGVSCESGLWVYTSRSGTRTTKAESPFEQAKSAMFELKKYIEKDNSLFGFVHGFGVIVPDDELRVESPEIVSEVLLDARDIGGSLYTYLQSIEEYWNTVYNERHESKPRPITPADMEIIARLLRPEVRSVRTLSYLLGEVETQQGELTNEQSTILRRMDSNPRTLIRGAAGTGKTVLALDKAFNCAADGSRVLFLCYNRLLGQFVQRAVKHEGLEDSITARSLHSFFWSVIQEAGLSLDFEHQGVPDSEFFVSEFAERFMDAVLHLECRPFDYLIVDEAQDILRPEYVDALDLVLDGGIEYGNWHLFLDPLQNIYHSQIELALEKLLTCGLAQFELTVNCRNTQRVVMQTSLMSSFGIPIDDAVEGGFAETIFYKDDAQFMSLFKKKLEALFNDGVKRSDFVVLSTRRLENSIVRGQSALPGMKIRDITTESTCKRPIDFCTIHAFKGLERPIVLLVDLTNLLDTEMKLLHYCGFSRARAGAIAFIPLDQKPAYDSLATEFGRRVAKGSINAATS